MRTAIGGGGLALLLCLGLGALVSGAPPTPFDLGAAALGGLALPLAEFLTRAGLFPVYATLGVLLLVFGAVRRRYLLTVVIALAALLIAWRVSDALKVLFHRPRPEHWYVLRETSFSYPSGHAVLATAFYGFAAFLIWRSALPRNVRIPLVAALVLWILAIGWSRLALGAHFPSDLLGGYLLGGSALCFEIAVWLKASKKSIEPAALHAGSR